MKFSRVCLLSLLTANVHSSFIELNRTKNRQLQVDEWLLERVDAVDAVTVSFDSSTDPEVCIDYRINPTKLTNIKVTIFQQDKTAIVPTTDIDFVADTTAPIPTDTDGAALYKVCFDIKEANIMANTNVAISPSATADFDFDIKFAPLVELLYVVDSVEESVSFSQPTVTIPVKLSADFTIAAFDVATVEEDAVSEDAVVSYTVSAFKCNADADADTTALPKNTPVRICINPDSTEVTITKILSLTLTQTDTTISRARITTTAEGVTSRDALTEVDVPLPETRGISVATRVGTEFYDDAAKTVTGTGTVELEFVSSRRRSLAHFNIMNSNNRNLQDEGAQSPFGVEIGLEADVIEEDSASMYNPVTMITTPLLTFIMMMFM